MSIKEFLAPNKAAQELGLNEDVVRQYAKDGIISSIPVGKSGKHFRIPVEIAREELKEYARLHAETRRNNSTILPVQGKQGEEYNLVIFDDLSRRLLDSSKRGRKTNKQIERESRQIGVM